MPMELVLVGIVCLAIGAFAAVFAMRNAKSGSIREAESKVTAAHSEAEQVMADAKRAAETLKKEALLEAKEEIIQNKQAAEAEEAQRKKEIRALENRVMQREESLDRRNEALDKREHQLSSQQGQIDKRSRELEELYARQTDELERIAELTREDAHAELLDKVRGEVTHEAATIIRESEQKVKAECHKTAQEIISLAIQRCASDHTAEVTVTSVHIPSDDLKGRIIGREGRNIRAIETATGVDLIIDDTPEAVILSGFDPVRREVARICLEKLIVDGRIHPARIEETVEKAEREVNQSIKEAGEQATFDVGIHNLHPELVKLLGRLKYRTSYGQNVLQHSVEVAHLAGLMASELGLDPKLAKRAGLLHDIGKSIDHEVEGTHVDIGIDLLRKYKESEAVISGMAAHHGDYEAKSLEAVLIAAADALSAARPGARRETLETYINRLQKLEEIANTTPGVEKSYAIQAGREIRIIARPEEKSDDDIPLLAREISKKIESELQYPGQIKVNVIRETRAIDYAK